MDFNVVHAHVNLHSVHRSKYRAGSLRELHLGSSEQKHRLPRSYTAGHQWSCSTVDLQNLEYIDIGRIQYLNLINGYEGVYRTCFCIKGLALLASTERLGHGRFSSVNPGRYTSSFEIHRIADQDASTAGGAIQSRSHR
jgi:hypothetical protein